MPTFQQLPLMLIPTMLLTIDYLSSYLVIQQWKQIVPKTLD